MFGFKRAKPEIFSDVLDRIRPAAHDADRSEAKDAGGIDPAPAVQSQDWLLQLLSGMGYSKSTEDKAPATPPIYDTSYIDDEIHFEEDVPPLLRAIASCEQDAIAEELGLSGDLSESELKKLRRTFARANHPDRLDPSQRDVATHRMTIANMLIDRELRQKSSAR